MSQQKDGKHMHIWTIMRKLCREYRVHSILLILDLNAQCMIQKIF